MIQVRNINGSPEITPDTKGGVYSDSEFFYFFETEQEFYEFITALPFVWDKDSYCQQVNEAHNDLFRSLYTERDYLSEGEIPIWQNDEDFSEESLALQQWWIETCKIVKAHLSTVTEETAQPIETFINSLPKFDN